jgi:hypothetical protein
MGTSTPPKSSRSNVIRPALAGKWLISDQSKNHVEARTDELIWKQVKEALGDDAEGYFQGLTLRAPLALSRCSFVSATASRRFVLTRSPGIRGIIDGGTATQS